MPTKYCPECGAGNHVRKSSCPCGYNFYTKAEPKTEPKFDIPDIAQQSRVAAKRSAPILEEPKTFFVGTTVAVPSGHCPISLNDTDAETVYAWADKVRRHHESQNERITNEGLLHYSRQFFPMHTKSVKGMTPEYLAVRILLGLDKTEGEAEE